MRIISYNHDLKLQKEPLKPNCILNVFQNLVSSVYIQFYNSIPLFWPFWLFTPFR